MGRWGREADREREWEEMRKKVEEKQEQKEKQKEGDAIKVSHPQLECGPPYLLHVVCLMTLRDCFTNCDCFTN